LQSIAQAITTYYQSFVPSAAQSPWPSDILFFIWPAPIFLMFLPTSDDTVSRIDWLRVLDFLQVAIVAVTMYLYFFFAPSRWLLEQPTVLRQILVIYVIRDLLFALGFAFRTRDELPPWFRSFSVVLTLVFSAAALSDLTDFVLVSASISESNLSDFIWMLPYATVVFFAAEWRAPSTESRSDLEVSQPIVSSQLLPVAMPLLVIFMSYAIAREHFLLAWLAVTASVVSSGFRLILTNRQQQRITHNLLNTEKALRRTERTLSTAFRSSPDSFSINPFPNGPYLEINDGFAALTGYSREDAIGRTPRDLDLWVDPSLREQVLSRLTETGFVRDLEFRFRKKSGEVRFGNMSASLIDYEGTPCSLVVVRDITDRKEADERQVLLAREVDHRARNALAVIQSIIRLTRAKSVDDYVQAIEGRIKALARAHTLLSDSRWRGADLGTLVGEELAPYRAGDKIQCHGPDISLQPATAQGLALALHELATNAAKYGALSTDTGRVDICWGADGNTFMMSWIEREGPPVSAPKRRGFGATVIEAMAERSVGGTVDLDYAPSGLTWRLTCPAGNALEWTPKTTDMRWH